jgi:amino acid transporter
MAADQVVAVANCIRFHYDDGRTHLSWVTGEEVNPAVWISIVLVVVVFINLIQVRVRMRLNLT